MIFCRLPTRFEAAKAADPPTTLTTATNTWTTTSQVASSGNRNTKAGPRSKSNRLSVKRVDGVSGFVTADKTPSSSALDSRPSCSIVDSDNPAFSAVDNSPAFSAFVSNLSCSTLVSSFTEEPVDEELFFEPIGIAVVPCIHPKSKNGSENKFHFFIIA